MEWISIVIGSAIGLGGWLAPRTLGGRIFKKFELNVTNTYPIYEHPNEAKVDHNVTLTLRNRSGVRIQATGWGFSTPGDRNLIVLEQPHWGAQLPTWIDPGSNLSLHIAASEIRRINNEEGIEFHQFQPWIDLADGRRIKSRKGVPLK